MSRVLTNEQNYYDIADTIRQMKNVNTTYKPRQMASALKDIYSNEVEGVPPLTFQANGNNLLNYRIDGASGGVGERTKNLCPYNKVNNSIIAHVESGKTYSFSLFASFLIGFNLMKRNASSQSTSSVATKYNSEGNVSATFTADEDFDLFVNGFSLISGKTFLESVSNFQLEESSTVTDYEPYGYKVPVMVEGKNLLQNTATSQTINGVTFTVNDDGSVTCNGRRENTSTFFTIGSVTSSGEIILSGCPSGGSSTSFTMRAYSATVSNPRVYYDIGDSYRLNTPDTYNIDIKIQSEYTCNNLTFYPMIRKADIEDDTYEPYIEPTITNIYLDKPIEAKANIPSEYEEVEYIESTGTQYIDTNYTPVQGDDLEFKNVTINTFNGALFSAGIESYQLILLGLGSVCYYKYFQTGNAVASSFSTITNGNIKVLNGNLYINNVLKAEADYGGAVDTTLNIFRRANNTSNLIGKIGEIIISNNGIIKRDFIPCYRKSDNVAGLYDLVNNTFYTNQGTGNFIVGPIKENESISLSDTNVDIPTIDGTNVLTINTTIQPSNVYVQAPKDTPKMVEARERLEVI